MRQTGFPAATYMRESAASRQTLDSAQTPMIALRADPQAELSRFGIPHNSNLGASMYESMRDPMKMSQVSYTFKQFKQDAKKDHTRHILPSVVKID